MSAINTFSDRDSERIAAVVRRVESKVGVPFERRPPPIAEGGSDASNYRFTMLEDAGGAAETEYHADIFQMDLTEAALDDRIVDTFGWLTDLSYQAGDQGIASKYGGKYYFISGPCGSGSSCPDGPSLSTSIAPPEGTVGASYTLSLTTIGTNLATAWTASSLPAGLSIDSSTGEITGTPTTAGTTDVTITASDEGACTATRIITITINEAP